MRNMAVACIGRAVLEHTAYTRPQQSLPAAPGVSVSPHGAAQPVMQKLLGARCVRASGTSTKEVSGRRHSGLTAGAPRRRAHRTPCSTSGSTPGMPSMSSLSEGSVMAAATKAPSRSASASTARIASASACGTPSAAPARSSSVAPCCGAGRGFNAMQRPHYAPPAV